MQAETIDTFRSYWTQLFQMAESANFTPQDVEFNIIPSREKRTTVEFSERVIEMLKQAHEALPKCPKQCAYFEQNRIIVNSPVMMGTATIQYLLGAALVEFLPKDEEED